MAGQRKGGVGDTDVTAEGSLDGLPPLTDEVGDEALPAGAPLQRIETEPVLEQPEPEGEGADPEVPEGHVLVVVAPRRTLRVPVGNGRHESDGLVNIVTHRTAHAGEIVAVRLDEVDDLRKLGFVVHGGAAHPPVLIADASLTGPTVNGRPGGMMQFGER